MKIFFIVGAAPPIPCGVGDQVYKLASNIWEKFGADIVFYTYYNPLIKSKENFKVYFFSNSKIRFYIKLIWILFKERPLVAHISYPNRGFTFNYPYFITLFLKMFAKKTLITFHEVPQKKSRIKNFFLKDLPDTIVLVREELVKEMKLKKFQIITNFSSIPISEMSVSDSLSLKTRIAKGKKLCSHFGFISFYRGVDSLFDILDPTEYHLLIIGSLDNSEYSMLIQKKIWSNGWVGNVTVTEYLDDKTIADLLFASDVVILPFREGSHEANTSTKAATIQGTYLITTSKERHGYDDKKNVFYAEPENNEEIKNALKKEIVKFPKLYISDDSLDSISKLYYQLFN